MKLSPHWSWGTLRPAIAACSPFRAGNFQATVYEVRSCLWQVRTCCWFAATDLPSRMFGLILQTDDGALILMTYRGVRHASPEVRARIARGDQVTQSDYYLRSAPFFDLADVNV